MITSVRFCLSYNLLNAILSPYRVFFNENLHRCNGRRYDVTCSRQKCYLTCGHNITYDMKLSIKLQERHVINTFNMLFVVVILITLSM